MNTILSIFGVSGLAGLVIVGGIIAMILVVVL